MIEIQILVPTVQISFYHIELEFLDKNKRIPLFQMFIEHINILNFIFIHSIRIILDKIFNEIIFFYFVKQ